MAGGTAENLKDRTKAMALRVIRMAESLPRGHTTEVIARQVIRSATSVAANYRAACRARSNAEFVAKLGIVEEECDETRLWLEMLVDAGLIVHERLDGLMNETNEIIAMTVASIKTARGPRK